MARESFLDKDFRPESLARIDLVNEIVLAYQAQGLRLTLRQLYYQLVVRNAIRNSEQSYKALGSLVSDARLAGLVDWDAIEDRVRIPRVPQEFKNLKDLVEVALNSYRLPRWEGQERYVELWVEKDALSGVLAPLASEYHVTMMVNRGYSSQSAMYDAAINRFAEAQSDGKESVLLYLGDHDPSGEDMVRDIRDRINTTFGIEVEVRKIALTMAQVRLYNPPPNPAKMTDSRAAKYVDEHGRSSWEVDALPPNVLDELIRGEIEDLFDPDLMDAIKAKEEQDKEALRASVKGLNP